MLLFVLTFLCWKIGKTSIIIITLCCAQHFYFYYTTLCLMLFRLFRLFRLFFSHNCCRHRILQCFFYAGCHWAQVFIVLEKPKAHLTTLCVFFFLCFSSSNNNKKKNKKKKFSTIFFLKYFGLFFRKTPSHPLQTLNKEGSTNNCQFNCL